MLCVFVPHFSSFKQFHYDLCTTHSWKPTVAATTCLLGITISEHNNFSSRKALGCSFITDTLIQALLLHPQMIQLQKGQVSPVTIKPKKLQFAYNTIYS